MNTPASMRYLEHDVDRIGKNVYDLEEKIFELEITWQVQFEKMVKKIDALESTLKVLNNRDSDTTTNECIESGKEADTSTDLSLNEKIMREHDRKSIMDSIAYRGPLDANCRF